ncbi:MAG: tyrosine-type recombinase/integrase family protein [Planctomycetaceae bacterium]|nr:tyrosine-type recombinase/integrase family protein [Planctomycetaceae bacterium]
MATAKKKAVRRAPGEGGLYQRGDGMWVGAVTFYDMDGKRKKKTVSSKVYRTAADKLEQLKQDINDGIAVNASMTMKDWLTVWLKDIHKQQVRPTTLRDYQGTSKHLIAHLGKKPISKITASDIRKMLNYLDIGTRKCQKAYVMLHRVLEDARKERIIRFNPCESVHKPYFAGKPQSSFTVEETQKLIATALTKRDAMEAARWITAFLTGERQAEVLGLEWDRVDFDNNVIDVSWQLQTLSKAHGCGPADKNGRYPCGKVRVGYCPDAAWEMPVGFESREVHRSMVLTKPKTRRGERFVPMVPDLRKVLLQLKELDTGSNPHGLVFHRTDGRPISQKDDNEAWHALISDAGVRFLKHHNVRRTTTTVLRTLGVDEQTRQEILGHATPEVQRIYALPDAARHAAAMGGLSILMPKDEDDEAESA